MRQTRLPRWYWALALAGYAVIVPLQVVLAVLGSPAGWMLFGTVPLGAAVWLRWRSLRPDRPRPRCAHCRRPIRSGLQLTDTYGPVTAHWHGDRAKCRAAADAFKRPDYVRIAVLEWELLGIEPEPGTLAATAVALSVFTPRGIQRDRSPMYFSGGRSAEELPPMPESWKPVPPPGRGAGSPTFSAAAKEHKRAMATLKEIHADLDRRHAEMDRLKEQLRADIAALKSRERTED